MKNRFIKSIRRIRNISLLVLAGTLISYGAMKLGASEDYMENSEYEKVPWKHYFKVDRKDIIRKGFSSMDGGVGEVKERECFWEYNYFTGGVSLSDITSPENGKMDGIVDKIRRFPRFDGKPTTLIRTRDYDNNKKLFDNANKEFAKKRKPYIKRIEKLAAKYVKKRI